MGLGTQGLGDAGTWDSGTWDVRTWDSGTPGHGTRGRRNSGRSGRKDVINKQHLHFALNLQFTILRGHKKGMMERSPVADNFQRP